MQSFARGTTARRKVKTLTDSKSKRVKDMLYPTKRLIEPEHMVLRKTCSILMGLVTMVIQIVKSDLRCLCLEIGVLEVKEEKLNEEEKLNDEEKLNEEEEKLLLVKPKKEENN